MANLVNNDLRNTSEKPELIKGIMEKHDVLVRFKDTDEEEEQCIAIGTYDEKTVSEEEDNTIFFYAENKNVYKNLFNEDNGEDFVVVKEL